MAGAGHTELVGVAAHCELLWQSKEYELPAMGELTVEVEPAAVEVKLKTQVFVAPLVLAADVTDLCNGNGQAVLTLAGAGQTELVGVVAHCKLLSQSKEYELPATGELTVDVAPPVVEVKLKTQVLVLPAEFAAEVIVF